MARSVRRLAGGTDGWGPCAVAGMGVPWWPAWVVGPAATGNIFQTDIARTMDHRNVVGEGNERIVGRLANPALEVCHRRFRRLAGLIPGQRGRDRPIPRSEEHTSELQSLRHLVCRLLLEKKTQ